MSLASHATECPIGMRASAGRLLAGLDDASLSSSTAVVVHADHGFSLGRHGRWSKYSLYEEVARVPLIVALPGFRAKVVDAPVELIDVLPTLLDLWGTPRANGVGDGTQPPKTAFRLAGRSVMLDGHSLLPLLAGGGGADGGGAGGGGAGGGGADGGGADGGGGGGGGADGGGADGGGADGGGGGVAGHVEAVHAEWPKWYARSELHERFRRNVLDGALAGASGGGSADVRRGAQYWVRTARFAYTAYFEVLGERDPAPGASNTTRAAAVHANGNGGVRLVDETMYNTGGADPMEVRHRLSHFSLNSPAPICPHLQHLPAGRRWSTTSARREALARLAPVIGSAPVELRSHD